MLGLAISCYGVCGLDGYHRSLPGYCVITVSLVSVINLPVCEI